jgi:hypothetical protein
VGRSLRLKGFLRIEGGIRILERILQKELFMGEGNEKGKRGFED